MLVGKVVVLMTHEKGMIDFMKRDTNLELFRTRKNEKAICFNKLI
jgi:hypothetical protein